MVLGFEAIQVEYSMMTRTSKTLKIEDKYKIFVYLIINLFICVNFQNPFVLGYSWSLYLLFEEDEVDMIHIK